MALRPVRLFLIGLMVGALAACGGSGPSGGTPPTVVPSTGPTGSTATCPLGSDPDEPGPAAQARPPFTSSYGGVHWVSAAFDRQSGRLVVVDSDGGGTWTFNVCANTWEHVATHGADKLDRVHLFYDAVDDLTYSISMGEGFPTVRTYSVETATWTRVLQSGGLWTWDGDWPRYVMDPTARVVYGYQSSTGQMRAYDIAANTWAEVDQGGPRPPTSVEALPSSMPTAGNQPSAGLDALMTFDPGVDRIVLSLGTHDQMTPDEAGGAPSPTWTMYSQTWMFDPGTGTWAQADSGVGPWFSCSMSGAETAYDEASRTSVVFAGGTMSTFDATAAEWTFPGAGTGWPSEMRANAEQSGAPLGPLARQDHGLVSDVVNGRVLMLGGTYRTGADTWQDGSDVWAYTAATNTWTQLVPEQPEQPGQPE